MMCENCSKMFARQRKLGATVNQVIAGSIAVALTHRMSSQWLSDQMARALMAFGLTEDTVVNIGSSNVRLINGEFHSSGRADIIAISNLIGELDALEEARPHPIADHREDTGMVFLTVEDLIMGRYM